MGRQEDLQKKWPIPDGLPEGWHDEWSVAIDDSEDIGDGIKGWTHVALERIAELELENAELTLDLRNALGEPK